VSFIITFGTLLFPIEYSSLRRGAQSKNVEIQIEKKQGGVKQITVINALLPSELISVRRCSSIVARDKKRCYQQEYEV